MADQQYNEVSENDIIRLIERISNLENKLEKLYSIDKHLSETKIHLGNVEKSQMELVNKSEFYTFRTLVYSGIAIISAGFIGGFFTWIFSINT